MGGEVRRRISALLLAILWIGATTAVPAAAEPVGPQQAVEQGVEAALDDGVDQYVALVDRSTGELVASSGGDTQVISESIVKLFTVSYYLVEYHSHLPAGIAQDLREMIVHSDDSIESRYWTTAAVPAMAKRYGLVRTANGPKTGPHDWGWEYITANDEAMFLYKASKDPTVGPFLMDAMAGVAPVAADGFEQNFGFNSLVGKHGSKQGWTDSHTSAAINIHSVGWTDKYFGAILQTSDSPKYDTMRADATATAALIDGLKSPVEVAAHERAAVSSAISVALARLTAAAQSVLKAVNALLTG